MVTSKPDHGRSQGHMPSNSNSLPIKSRQVSRWLNSVRSIPNGSGWSGRSGWSGWSGLSSWYKLCDFFSNDFKADFCLFERLYSLPSLVHATLGRTWEQNRTLQTRDFVGVWAMHLRCGEQLLRCRLLTTLTTCSTRA